ncbi:hypothetical protein LJ739_05760 [Aestuariibacter halophilus]|uniref:IPT/TIG domain-containing protein n=1 Tax=Fluctibacter halophilus TaxID=226011 RepID=A0ABS8G575_9ALTE|nr:hypothetical protein [Aestuariibacter halophilus]MCC2615742.1 hypothetical protein [Aestuariibacter halophilus]
MTTITLVQAPAYDTSKMSAVITKPGNVHLTGLGPGGIQFSCTNPFPAVSGQKQVDITYDGSCPTTHQTVDISSVQP